MTPIISAASYDWKILRSIAGMCGAWIRSRYVRFVQRRPRDGRYFSPDSFLTPFQGKNVVSDDCPQKPLNER